MHKAFSILLFFIATFTFANPILNLNKEKTNYPLDLIPFVSVFQTSDSLSPTELYYRIKNNNIDKKASKASQGFSENYFWIKFTLDGSNTENSLILEVNNPHIDNIELYELNGNWEKIGFGGDKGKKFEERSYINRRYIFPIEVNKEKKSFLLMVDKRNASVSFPMKLWVKERFLKTEAKNNIYYGVFFGMLFFMSFVSLVFGLLIKRRLLILYGTHSFLMILYLFTALGFSFQYLYPESPIINNYARVLLIVFIACISTMFSREFLKLDKHIPKISFCFKAINITLVCLFVTWLFFMGLFRVYTIWILNFIYILLFAIFLLSYLSAFMTYKLNRLYSLTYIAAFSSLIIGCCLYMSIEYGLIQENIFPLNPILLGSGLEIIILSTSMLKWTKDIFNDKNKLQQQKFLLELENAELMEKIKLVERQERNHEEVFKLKNNTEIFLKEITYIASDGHYLEFYRNEDSKPIIDRISMKEAAILLPEYFIRTHRSYIVNTDYIKTLKATQVILNNGQLIPLSRSYKNLLKNRFLNN